MHESYALTRSIAVLAASVQSATRASSLNCMATMIVWAIKERRVRCVGDSRKPRRNEGGEGELDVIYATLNRYVMNSD